MDNIAPGVIQLLIELGQIGDAVRPEAKPLLEALRPHDEVNRLYHATWYAACENLSLGDHAALVKGLVIAEERLAWCGGSVAGAIWAYRAFAIKVSDRADELATWCLAHTTNEYVPFGTRNHDAKTAQEYRIACRELNEYRKLRQAEINNTELISREWKTRRRAQVERARVGRQSAERKMFLDGLLNRSLSEQLTLAAFDTEYPINWYPTSIAGACRNDTLTALEPSIKAALLERLKGKQHGPWLALKKRIRGQ